jgi:hypothetical protein
VKQDVNRVTDLLSAEWSNQLAHANKKIAILAEENNRLKDEIKTIKESHEGDVENEI